MMIGYLIALVIHDDALKFVIL